MKIPTDKSSILTVATRILDAADTGGGKYDPEFVALIIDDGVRLAEMILARFDTPD